MTKAYAINLAEKPADVAAVKQLFIEYSQWLDVDLCFQGIEEEFRTFPAKYDLLLLAKGSEGQPIGAVGFWTLEPGVCEMKRLFVRDEARGLGLGMALSTRLMAEAKARGYHTMKLDTLARLKAATHLYESLGFIKTEAYNHNPETDILYFYKEL